MPITRRSYSKLYKYIQQIYKYTNNEIKSNVKFKVHCIIRVDSFLIPQLHTYITQIHIYLYTNNEIKSYVSLKFIWINISEFLFYPSIGLSEALHV